ncbi:flagellar biosynthetic protein FliR, partial [Hyphomonas sp.]|uniref:flagellar biosynthetic protein FliR n=1 Tax=Hyphomonas sp. TaxID=87 RepID=UPI0037C0FD77
FAGLVLLLDLGFLHMLVALPAGSVAPGGAGLRDAISVSGRAILLGLVLAAPVAIFNTAVNLASGLANRFLPAFPMSMLVMPLQILAGMALVGSMLASPALRSAAREFLRSLGA